MALFKKKDKAAKAAKPKKAKKQKKAKAPKTPGVALEKPGMNVYTVMLMLSLLAITTACILLYSELGTYGGFGDAWKTR